MNFTWRAWVEFYIDNIKPPRNFDEAMQSDDWENWCYVTAKELRGMQKMGVFSKEEAT